MKELTVEARVENLEVVTAFVDTELRTYGCPQTMQMKFDIAIDELFGNIVQYAYPAKTGSATIQIDFEEASKSVVLTFLDSGVAFNPLLKTDPDIHLPAEERSIGGLGIYMVKKSMDELTYQYQNGQNILKIKKKLPI